MNDYFQILIYLIIIFAFLNSLFKKKDKKDPPRPSNSPGPGTKDTYTSDYEQKAKQSEYDILKEIEGLFKGEHDYSSQRKMESDIEKADMRKVPRSEHTEDKEWHTGDSEWHTGDSEWHTEEEEWHEQSTSEHQLEKSWHSITQYKRAPEVDTAIVKEAKKFEQMLADRNKEVPYPFKDLRKKLYSPETLQDYIVVSEIIGKPKYLRR